MNKGSARSGILGISPSRRGEMSQNVIVPERVPSPEGSFDKIKGRDSASNAGINGGVAVKSTLFNPDRNIKRSNEVSHIDYRGKFEQNPDEEALKEVFKMGKNIAAFRANAAEGSSYNAEYS